jgi:hypothetical protein
MQYENQIESNKKRDDGSTDASAFKKQTSTDSSLLPNHLKTDEKIRVKKMHTKRQHAFGLHSEDFFKLKPKLFQMLQNAEKTIWTSKNDPKFRKQIKKNDDFLFRLVLYVLYGSALSFWLSSNSISKERKTPQFHL